MPLLQRKWSDEQVASAKSMKHTKHVKSGVLFVYVYVHMCLCHTPSVLVAAFELCPGPVSKTKANKSCQPVLLILCLCVCVRVSVCACLHECSLVCASECVYLQALEHVLCKENTTKLKKYSHAQHTLSHKHTTRTHSHTHAQKRRKQYTIYI